LSNVSNTQHLDPFGAQKPLYNAHRIDLSLTAPGNSPRRLIKDPLLEDVFYKAHRKAERHEKQLRNIERERAQHEKVQLDRLLEELKGPDWLKVMGISGVTESEKKLYEPKRVFFIREVAGLIGKFRHWKEEEKRRKMEREQALLAEEETEEEGEVGEEEEVGDQESHDDSNDSSQQPAFTSAPSLSTPPAPPDTNDVDAAAARQLHQEAISASSPAGTSPRKTKPLITNPNPCPSVLSPLPHPKQDPGSFFAKRHMRDAAIAGHRRGRNKLAFGEPVPDPEEEEFQLPSSILTTDMIRARARLRRRLNRGSSE
jgi:Something about silencing, SAS, complex subunit 4